MDKTTIKLYKDESSNELIISISPLTKNIEDIVSALIKTTITEVPSLEKDKDYIEQEQDYTKEQEQITFRFQDGEYVGKTPMEVIQETNSITEVIKICLAAKDKTVQEYISCAKALKDFINTTSFEKDICNSMFSTFSIVCPNLVQKCIERGNDKDTEEGQKMIVQLCAKQLLKIL